MASPVAPSRRLILATGIAALLSLSGSSQGQSYHWDPGADGDGSVGGTGAWNLTNPFWSPVALDPSALDNIIWPNSNTAIAVFGGSAGIVTIGAPTGVTANGVTFNTSGYQISSAAAANVLTLAGATPTITLAGAGSTSRINSVIAGSGFTTAGAGTLVLAGANTFTGQTTIGSGTIVALNSGASLGASGVGNETVIQAGGTLNVGGQNIGAERLLIAGNGVGGMGAIVNQGASQNNATQFVALTANATVSSGGPSSFGAGGNYVTAAPGRWDIRPGAYTAGAKNLDLAGNTLTKIGDGMIALVNADISPGNLVIDQGMISVEAGTTFSGTGTITVNPDGKLAFYSLSGSGAGVYNGTTNNWGVVLNGGSFGDGNSTAAAQTVPIPVKIAGAITPNFTAVNSSGTTLSGVISKDAASTVTEVAKRGAGLLTFSNVANTFDAGVTIYQGTLRANFQTGLGAGGVNPAAPLTSSDTPLGTNDTIRLAGGTLSLRVNMANDNTQQRWDLQRNIVVDMAPGTMDFDRLSNGTQSDKSVTVSSLTFAPSAAANYYSIGQNQLTFNQLNTHRIEVGGMTMNGDTVLTNGDFIINGNVTSAGRNSLVHTGGSSWGFISGTTHEFNAVFNAGNANFRVGSMYGTSVTNNTATVGTGTIYNAPNNGITFRTPTNLAAGQVIETFSSRITQSVVNFEQFTSVPANLRATGTGILGVGNATAFGNIDLSVIGDGTFRIGSNFAGSSAGTITGVVSPGANGLVRVGAGGSGATLTLSGTNRVTGTSTLDVGSDLIHGGFRTSVNGAAQSGGTVVLTGANDYSGGTNVNRGSILRFRNNGSLGSGAVNVFGTLAPEQAGGAFTADGLTNVLPVNLMGGSTLFFDNGVVTGTANVNRWGDNAPIALTSSNLQINSRNNNTSTTSETVGAISFSGGSFITLNRQNAVAGNNVELVVDSLTRLGGGTLEVVSSTNAGSGFGSGNILKSNTAPAVTNEMVLPYITVNSGTRFSNFATFDATGINNAAYTHTVNNAAFTTGLTAGTEIVFVDFPATGTSSLGDAPDVYALKVGTGNGTVNTSITNGVGNQITIRSGGLIFSGDSTAGFSTSGTAGTSTINPAIRFHNGTSAVEGIVNVRTGTTGILAGAVTGNGLTKSGGGMLQLTANNAATLSGPVNVNQGTLELRAAGAAGTGNITLAGGQLNVRINGAETTYVNGITIAQNLPIAVLDVGNILVNSGSNTNANAIIFNGAAAGTPGLVFQGSPGVQGQTFTLQTNGNGTGSSISGVTFGNNMDHSIAGNATFNITGGRTLTLNNNPTISGTAPVITKSGDGTLIVGVAGATGSAKSVSSGTKVVVDNGTLELRDLLAFGTGGSTSITLNRGTLNLRANAGGTFGSSAGYALTVEGNSTLSTDRASGSGVSYVAGLGKLTVNNNATLTLSNGSNGVYPEFAGAQLNGTAFFSANIGVLSSQDSAARFAAGNDVGGGALVKQGSGHLHMLNANNTYSGGTYIQQGILRARAANALGTGNVYLNPGAIIDLNAANNLAPTQQLIVRGNSSFLPMISVNNVGVTTIAHPTANVDASGARFGIVGISNGISGSYSTGIDLGALYGGRWSLGGISASAYDPVYTATTLGVGADNLYRLGGGGTSFAMGINAARAANNNVLTGNANVRLGFDSGNILGANATNYQFSIAGVNDFSGGSTVIHRGMVARLLSNNNGIHSGLSNSQIDVFGEFALAGAASLDNGSGNVNVVNLHPGSALFFDNQSGAGNNTGALVGANNTNRWNDSTPISLNGAMINLIGRDNAASLETVGDVTYRGGARLRAARGGTTTGTTLLTLNSLTPGTATGATLTLQSSASGTLGGVDKIVVATNAPVPTYGMVSPSIVNALDHTFVDYDVLNGFMNATYDKVVTTGSYTAGSLLPTDKVDVTTGALTLTDNPTVYALRTSQSINVGGPFTQVNIRSGGFIGTGGTIQPNLVFNDGTSNIEARMYVNGTVTMNGTITANGVTKFGTGNLTINVPQAGASGQWTVNAGTLQINDPQGLGSGPVTLNASHTTGGLASQATGQTQLIFNRDQGTPELVTFSGGPITVVNEATIRIVGADNRNLQIPEVIARSTGSGSSVALTLDVPSNRFRAQIPTLTLESDTTARVLDTGSTGDYGRITAAAVQSLVGSSKNLTKVGNRTLELTGDNSATFTGGSITVSQGTVRVRENGSLGSATTAVTIERNAALEIAKSNFNPANAALITQQAGSIERWNVEDARGATGSTYNLPAGVNLQLNANLLAARTIGLNGGSLEGFIYSDHVAAAAERTVGSSVTVNLLANSFVGQNILQGQAYDAGRLPTVTQPYGDNVTGAFLRIDGNITGAFNLTKTGMDTVTLAGTGNTYNDTIVELGVLRIAGTNVLPTGKTLTTRNGGTFDLYGNDQTVAGLGVANAGTDPGGTSVGSSGRITNSGVVNNTLKVNNSANFTYNGTIERNVALTKSGNGVLTLGGDNTYLGNTMVESGTLAVTGSISGSRVIQVNSGATLDVSGVTGAFPVGVSQTLGGSGTVVGSLAVAGALSPGSGVGTLTATGPVAFNAGSGLSLEIAGAASYDQLAANGVSLDGTVNLTIDLGVGYVPAPNTTFIVLNNTSASAISGLFTMPGTGVLNEGATFFVSGQGFNITYQGGIGANDVVITAIPEPATAASLIGGVGLLLGLRRRRRISSR